MFNIAFGGEGYFLGSDHILQVMQRDYFYPSLADRNDPGNRARLGAKDAWAQAKARAIDILDSHNPVYLSPDADRTIRQRFNILC